MKLNENLYGKYSDKFKRLIREYSNDPEVIVSIVDDIIRYSKEEDLRDLWIELDYDRIFEDFSDDIYESFNRKKSNLSLTRKISKLVLNDINNTFCENFKLLGIKESSTGNMVVSISGDSIGEFISTDVVNDNGNVNNLAKRLSENLVSQIANAYAHRD